MTPLDKALRDFSPWVADRVIVSGGRHYDDEQFLFEALDRVRPRHIVHGNASGADSLAGRWAEARGVPQTRYPAQWKRYGKKAGPLRNNQMATDGADLLVAFPGGAGTADMVSAAWAYGIRVLDLRAVGRS